MDRVEITFKNPIVKVWFLSVLPAVVIASILFLLLPVEKHIIPYLLLIFTVLGYETWRIIYVRRKRR